MTPQKRLCQTGEPCFLQGLRLRHCKGQCQHRKRVPVVKFLKRQHSLLLWRIENEFKKVQQTQHRLSGGGRLPLLIGPEEPLACFDVILHCHTPVDIHDLPFFQELAIQVSYRRAFLLARSASSASSVPLKGCRCKLTFHLLPLSLILCNFNPPVVVFHVISSCIFSFFTFEEIM